MFLEAGQERCVHIVNIYIRAKPQLRDRFPDRWANKAKQKGEESSLLPMPLRHISVILFGKTHMDVDDGTPQV